MGARSSLQNPTSCLSDLPSLAGSPILIAALSEGPSSFPNKIVAGSSNISSNEDWLPAFQRRCSLLKKSKKGRVNEGGVKAPIDS